MNSRRIYIFEINNKGVKASPPLQDDPGMPEVAGNIKMYWQAGSFNKARELDSKI